MRCPRCSCENDKVIDSRMTPDGSGVRRRRECTGCGALRLMEGGVCDA